MRLREAIINCPSTGICEIDLDKAVRCFGKLGFISRWHDEYTLVNTRAGVKVAISKDDAMRLVELLDLVELKSGIFAHGSSFVRKERLL